MRSAQSPIASQSGLPVTSLAARAAAMSTARACSVVMGENTLPNPSNHSLCSQASVSHGLREVSRTARSIASAASCSVLTGGSVSLFHRANVKTRSLTCCARILATNSSRTCGQCHVKLG